jgi:succinate dehydrogenase / fumarate reductase flavoprotein subunit
MGCNVTAAWRAARRGALFANPCFTQIHPTCIPVSGDYQSKLTLMSESLRNDGRIWVPKSKQIAQQLQHKQMNPADVAEDDRDYYLERKYPSFGNLSPRDISSRAAKEACDDGRGIAPTGLGVYLDFRDATKRLGEGTIRSRYGNLFQMYEKITGEDPYQKPMMIYPAVHYTMGGLWVDYNLMSNVPGLHVLGEANFSDHGANRLGASALMQGLADGYFVIPTTLANYLVTQKPGSISTTMPEFKQTEVEVRERTGKLLAIQGRRTVDSFHRELGMTMWDHCGMARSREGLTEALAKIPAIREEFWKNVRIPGSGENANMELEKAGRVADFLEFAEVMCYDARDREESCGGHFRLEHQFFDQDPDVIAGNTQPGEAKRDDANFSHVSAWEYAGPEAPPVLHKEPLKFEDVHVSIRSYA